MTLLVTGPGELDLGPVIVYRDDLDEIVAFVTSPNTATWIEADGRRFESVEALAERVGPRILRELHLRNNQVPGQVDLHLMPTSATLSSGTLGPKREFIVAVLGRRRRRMPGWLAARLRCYSTVHLTPWKADRSWLEKNRDWLIAFGGVVLGVALTIVGQRLFGGT